MWPGTKALREDFGRSSASTSVGEILKRTGDAYPAISRSPIGESLMQVTLSPQEAADLLFYLMSAMSTASASTTTASMARIPSFIEDARYGPGTADALEERYRDSHFKGKTTKEWSKREYEAKIEEIKGKLAAL